MSKIKYESKPPPVIKTRYRYSCTYSNEHSSDVVSIRSGTLLIFRYRYQYICSVYCTLHCTGTLLFVK
jgi:hypothetical protein